MADDGSAQSIAIRDALAADTMQLAQLAIMAGHGLLDIFYGGLIPGKSTAEIVAERRMLHPGNFAELANWRVARDGAGGVLGALNSFPHDVFEKSPPDPLLTAERLAVVDTLTKLETSAIGTYYINIIAVFPGHRNGGIGGKLLAEAERLARRGGFRRLALSTFAADTRLVDFYRSHGFRVLGTRPITPHPALEHGGNWALMGRDLGA
jgi:ribosomal protein S18 acetylase RimI-like enzyme